MVFGHLVLEQVMLIRLKKKIQKYIGSKDCIAVNSGTAALDLALSAINIKNKEVIIPSLSFVSTANAVISNGGKPIFAEIDPETLCIDPEDIEKKNYKEYVCNSTCSFCRNACKSN